jgi:chromate transporter
VIPSFVVILVIAMFFTNFREQEMVTRIFKGLRPAVVALIVVPGIRMLEKKKFEWSVVLIAALAAVAIAWLKISPILVMLVAGIGGIVYFLIRKRR